MLPSWFPTIFGVEDKVPVTVIGTCGFGSLGVPGHPEISTIGVSAPTPAFSFIPPVSVVSLDTFIPYFTAPVNIDTPPTKLGLDDLIPAIQIGRNIFPPASEIVAFPIDPRVFYPTQETKISIETLNPECKARILKTENIFGSLVCGPDIFSMLGGMGNTDGYSLLFSLGNQLQQLITLPMGDCGLLKIWSTLSDCYVHIQKLLNSLKVGDPLTGIETLRSGISFHNDLQSVMSRLSDDITSILAYRNTLSDSTQSLQSIVNELALKDDIQAIIKIIGSLTEQSVCRPSCTLELFLNSIPIMNNITDCSITIGRDTVFDVIQLSSTDSRFFSKVNNSSEWPSLGIEAIYQGTSWSFLVEEVTGNERSFSIWGRSFAAKKSAEPFKKETTYVVESDQLASDLADDLIPELAISWQVVDWLITDGYTVTGTPIEMLKELAASVGAVVRATPDGTGLQVAHKFPIRPVNLQSATSVDSFDRETNITLLDLSCIHGDASNSVVVYGQSLVDQFSLIFEAEESCVVVDQLAYLRVYPAMSGAGYLLASTGLAPTYESAHMEDYDEVVYFITGKASVSRPIKELISIEWDGLVPVGGYTWTVGSSNVVLNSGGIAVGRIKYKTSYDRWSVGHVGLGDLLVVLFQDKDSGTTARVYFGAGDREAESISRPNLTSLEAAIEAGKAWLDDNSYNKLKCALKTPCVNLMDGQIVSLESVPSGVEGNWLVFRHVISASIVDNTRKVWSNLDVVQFEQP